jgi:hypothetical protein
MVIAVEQLELAYLPAVKRICVSRPQGRVTSCQLPAGHAGFHETRIWTRRPTGIVVSYRFAWLGD